MTGRDAPAAGDARAISTVLDAAVFLLLVSAAVGLLYAVPQSPNDAEADPDVAAEATTTLATSIETIEYAPAPDGTTDAAGINRTDRGTIGELLAETTVSNARFGGKPFASAPNHEAAVRNATRLAISRFDGGIEVQVRTRWRPLPGSGLRGSLVVGPDPPSDADVHAATVAIPVGTATSSGPAQSNWTAAGNRSTDGTAPIDRREGSPPGRSESLETVAAERGCSGLGHAIAARVVGATFPPERVTLSSRAGGAPAERLRTRYATATRALGLDPPLVHATEIPRQSNEQLATELSKPLTAACAGYESPEAAAERASPNTVVVSVRTWSP